MKSCWHEPMLRVPVVIIESDDWGPASESDADVLGQIISVLKKYKDRQGRHPVMTIGTILAIPDTQSIRDGGGKEYSRLVLDDPQFSAVREKLKEGAKEDVFALQLHGLEHYWPPALLSIAESDRNVHQWLTGERYPRTEDLPSKLQSRWTDASCVPSRWLSHQEIKEAVNEEVEIFKRVFNQIPYVVIPPTFLWTEQVEQAWSNEGVEVIVTPGRRYESRDEDGRLVENGSIIYNGEKTNSGLVCIVRKDYFEPGYGHNTKKGLAALEQNINVARPTLFETHRFNFTGSEKDISSALNELDMLINAALQKYPGLLFMPTYDLAKKLTSHSSGLVINSTRHRLRPWLRRLSLIPGMRKVAYLTGAIMVAWVINLFGLSDGSISPVREGR